MALTDINYGCSGLVEVLETLITLRRNDIISKQDFIDYLPVTVKREFILDDIDLFPIQKELLDQLLEPPVETAYVYAPYIPANINNEKLIVKDVSEKIESRFEILDL